MGDEGAGGDDRKDQSPVKSFKSSQSLKRIHSKKLTSKPSLGASMKFSQRSLFSTSSFAVKPSEAERMTFKVGF